MSLSLVWHFADEKATFASGRVLGQTGFPIYKSSFLIIHLDLGPDSNNMRLRGSVVVDRVSAESYLGLDEDVGGSDEV